ncbi:MAG: hypothetical protein FIB06_13235 [Betaproteobacteria bacterium]|nr:hypothetical protein [Betaproteobacteria bacterium]
MDFLGVLLFLVVLAYFLSPIVKGYKEGRRSEEKEAPINRVTTTGSRSDGTTGHEADQDHDNWEGAFWDVQSPRNVKADLRIEYRDGAGSVTKRDIQVMKYGAWDGGAILWAYCQLRRANRTFRTDRVISCTDLDTGEVIEELEKWLDAKYQESPDRAIEQVIETAWDAVRVLFYVSKADGRLTQKERTILRDAIRSMSDHPAVNDSRIDDLIQALDTPSTASFKQAFGRLANRNRALAEKVAVWAEAMVATEKTVAAAEQEAVAYLRARLVKTPSAAEANRNAGFQSARSLAV